MRRCSTALPRSLTPSRTSPCARQAAKERARPSQVGLCHIPYVMTDTGPLPGLVLGGPEACTFHFGHVSAIGHRLETVDFLSPGLGNLGRKGIQCVD